MEKSILGLKQMRFSGLKPTGATYGLAMEVMLRAGKHDFVYKFFEKMQKSGLPPRALTYKVLVRAFWEEGKVDEAVETPEKVSQKVENRLSDLQENSNLSSSFSEEGESDEDIKSDQSLGQSNQALNVPVPATQSQQATSGSPHPVVYEGPRGCRTNGLEIRYCVGLGPNLASYMKTDS